MITTTSNDGNNDDRRCDQFAFYFIVFVWRAFCRIISVFLSFKCSALSTHTTKNWCDQSVGRLAGRVVVREIKMKKMCKIATVDDLCANIVALRWIWMKRNVAICLLFILRFASSYFLVRGRWIQKTTTAKKQQEKRSSKMSMHIKRDAKMKCQNVAPSKYYFSFVFILFLFSA